MATEQLSFGLVITDPDAHRQEIASKPRRCLCCRSEFASTGPGNRVCRRCRSTDAFASVVTEHAIHASF